MTIAEQYNNELNRIYKEVYEIVVGSNERPDHIFRINTFKTLALKEKAIEIAILITVKSDGKFLFPEGQRENPCVTSLLSLIQPYEGKEGFWGIEGKGKMTYEEFKESMLKGKPLTLSQLFLENCLLSGVDEVDLNKIENLKKVKFV